MNRDWVRLRNVLLWKLLGPSVLLFVTVAALGACGGVSQAQGPVSGRPSANSSPESVWMPIMGTGGYLSDPTREDSYVDVDLKAGPCASSSAPPQDQARTERRSPFVVELSKTPQLVNGNLTEPFARIPVRVVTRMSEGYRIYDVRSSKSLTSGEYQLVYSGSCQYRLVVYTMRGTYKRALQQ